MAGIVGLTTLQHQNATNALTVDASGYLTASQPVLAKLRLTSDQTDLTDESYNKLKLDEAAIDTKSGFDNSNDLYVIPVAGYYRIYVQAHIGVITEQNSLRDSGLVITNTQASNSTEVQIATSHHRHYVNPGDTSDVTENIYTIHQFAAGDKIAVYTYGNTDTGTAYDVFADIDGGNDNSHMNTGLPGTGSGEDNSTFVIIERII